MKKQITIAILLLALLANAATATTISVADSKGAKGDKVKVPINIAGASNLGAIGIVLSYDPSVLKGTGAEGGTLASNAMVESNEVSPGNMRISFADSRGISGNGVIVEAVFEVVGDSGSSTQIAIIQTRGYDSNLLDVPLGTKPGTFIVEEASLPIIPIIGAIIVLLIAVIAYKKISKKKQ